MGSISPGESSGLNSFPGHIFHFRAVKGSPPTDMITIEAGRSKYTVGEGVLATDEDVEEPEEDGSGFRSAFPVKFRNLCGHEVRLWYDPGHEQEAQMQDKIAPGGDATTNSYPGHAFCFTLESATGCDQAICRVKMDPDTYTYTCDDGTGSEAEALRWRNEDAFNLDYRNQTGRHWISFWPRKPPQLYMHEAKSVGSEIQMRTSHPLEPIPAGMSDPALLTLKVVATEPRAFVIPHFLSETEVAYLVALGTSKVQRSLTGSEGQFSDTRTSKNTWVRRETSNITERIFRRAADVLNIDERVLSHGDEGAAEHMQLVHYDVGDRYDAHYDWGVDKDEQGSTRLVTLLLYLNEPLAGGKTAFPRAKRGPEEEPLVLHPGRGSAVLFYNLLEDGNADIDSMHAALPVTKGEKWLANFWIWDPVKPKSTPRL